MSLNTSPPRYHNTFPKLYPPHQIALNGGKRAAPEDSDEEEEDVEVVGLGSEEEEDSDAEDSDDEEQAPNLGSDDDEGEELEVCPNSHGARPVHLIITMINWIRTSSDDEEGEELEVCPTLLLLLYYSQA